MSFQIRNSKVFILVLLLSFLSVTISMPASAQVGLEGPQGPEGPQGDTGPQVNRPGNSGDSVV